MKMNIKKGDNVLVIAGKDKGKTGKVMEVSPSQNKATVENINMVTKHKKPRNAQEKGGIIKVAAPMEISNLMVVCQTCGKATRVARKEVDGKNCRICKKCGASLDRAYVRAVKKEAKKAVKAEAKEEKKKDSNVKARPEAKTQVKTKAMDKTVTTPAARKTGSK